MLRLPSFWGWEFTSSSIIEKWQSRKTKSIKKLFLANANQAMPQNIPTKEFLGKSTEAKADELSVHLNIKPLSVNEAWQGQRFKTKSYLAFEKLVLLSLRPMPIPQPPFSVSFEFGMSNSLSDYDNPVKPLQDVLQKKYGFNDKDIFEAHIRKVKVKKGRNISNSA